MFLFQYMFALIYFLSILMTLVQNKIMQLRRFILLTLKLNTIRNELVTQGERSRPRDFVVIL